MPKINVYLPDDLAAAVKAAEIPVSAVCQKALADAVQAVTLARRTVALLRDPEFDPDSRPELVGRLAGRMTDRLKASVELGHQAAAGGPVGTRHLLVGLVDEGGNLAVRLLSALGEEPEALREAALGSGAEEPPARAAGVATRTEGSDGFWSGLTMPARGAVGAALEAALDLGHNYIGCEHLLLGLLGEEEGGAGRILRAAGLDAAAVRRAVTTALAGFAQARQGANPPGAESEFRQLARRLDAIESRLGAAGL